jgi:hypothetical protein
LITIPIKILIHEITNALNKSEFKVGDIVYYFALTTEYKLEILSINNKKVTLLIIGSSNDTHGIQHFNDFNLVFNRDLDILKRYHYSKTPKLKW